MTCEKYGSQAAVATREGALARCGARLYDIALTVIDLRPDGILFVGPFDLIGSSKSRTTAFGLEMQVGP